MIRRALRALLVPCMLILTACAATGAMVTASFEELGLAPGAARNDFTANDPDGFLSQGVFFNNSYSQILYNGTLYESWGGWAASAVADVVTPGFNPVTFALQNQFAAYHLPSGSGASDSLHYLVGYTSYPNEAFFDLPAGAEIESIEITNTTYAAISMLNEDAFAKKFGGPNGTDADYFRLTITGFSGAGASGATVGAVEFYLADYRSSSDYIITTWTTVDLGSLAGSRSVGFSLDSSDNTDFGGGLLFMNTPSYFAMDNLKYSIAAVPEPGSFLLLGLGLGALTLGSRLRFRHPIRRASRAE